MLKSIRRVVTGHNDAGRSIIIVDGPAPSLPVNPDWPTRGINIVWADPEVPVSNEGRTLAEDRTHQGAIPLGTTGASFMIMHLPPESELEKLTPEQQNRVTVPVARTFPGAYELDTSHGYFMHGTDTVDYLVIVSGEVTVLADEGEVTLKAGDTMIQRGGNHGWINRSNAMCIVAAVAVKAKPISRAGYPEFIKRTSEVKPK